MDQNVSGHGTTIQNAPMRAFYSDKVPVGQKIQTGQQGTGTSMTSF
jgi:hypothetical protein